MSKSEQRKKNDEGLLKRELWERATLVVVHALLRLPRGSNKRDDIATSVPGDGAGKVRGLEGRDRSRTRAICSEIVLLRTARGRRRTRTEERRKRKDKNVPSFLRARVVRRIASCPAEHRGVTFAGCDVENWIQVWGGVYRREGNSQGSRERGRNEGCAREARVGRERKSEAEVRGRKSCCLLKEVEEG